VSRPLEGLSAGRSRRTPRRSTTQPSTTLDPIPPNDPVSPAARVHYPSGAMVYRTSMPAPASRVAEERRGQQVGIFCLECGSVFALHKSRHTGKPVYGKDHISSPCSHEGEEFEPGATWWEPAIEVLPPPPEPSEAETAAEQPAAT